MKREARLGIAALRRRPLLALLGWSALELPSAALPGLTVAHALDDGFGRHRPAVGIAWIAGLFLAAAIGALASRNVFAAMGELVETFRDGLVRRVVSGALRTGVAGGRDDGAVARLTRQVEIVRDAFAGLLASVRGFAVAVVGASAGMLALDPVMALILLPPFLAGVAVFAAVLTRAASRQRACVLGDEEVAATTGAVLAARRDIAARGAEDHIDALAAGPIRAQARAERAMARLIATRSVSFAIGGWLPPVVLLAAGPALLRHGLGAGALVGGLTFAVSGLQPALRTVMSGLGDSGLRYTVTLGRILEAEPPEATAGGGGAAPAHHALEIRDLTFAYGPASEPVLRDLDLTIDEGEHLAVVGPSGIGKSTLAALLCGLRRPDAGEVRLGGVRVGDIAAEYLPALRTLVPQEAYLFSGTVRDNIAYLRPDASDERILASARAVGADGLLARIGGLQGRVTPGDLSAGERQLIALARAHLSPARLVVLDEATCHLDQTAEHTAETAFLRRGGTLIVIGHRLTSALRARRVLILDGDSALTGDHETLLSRSALYRELVGSWTDPALAAVSGLSDAAAPGPVDPSQRADCGDLRYTEPQPTSGTSETV
ncbi:MAG: ABC transporter ATP-binding protein [Catenulisporales bacterium]|jgi:ATP-binding cassette, subfamily C, bacterial|nr:ABC transporter ATP-binding protein [Catenulisporales bacterium]